MRHITLILLFFLTINYFCTAEVVNANDSLRSDKRVAVYLHPVAIIGSASTLLLNNHRGNNPSLFLYATIEKPINTKNSLIIRPNIWYHTDSPFLENGRAGCDIGWRHYFNIWSTTQRTSKVYVAGQTGMFYYSGVESYEWIDYFFDTPRTEPVKKKLWLDVMCYLGLSSNYHNGFRMFVDAGIGYGNIQHNREVGVFLNSNFIFDVNVGVGFAIGKQK